MTINQSSQNLAINWQSYNIGSAASVTYVQPSSSSVALNRVVGSGATEIYGRLNANGQVFILNSNGILFGANAQVNVGSLVASTLSLSDADFMAGNYHFSGNRRQRSQQRQHQTRNTSRCSAGKSAIKAPLRPDSARSFSPQGSR